MSHAPTNTAVETSHPLARPQATQKTAVLRAAYRAGCLKQHKSSQQPLQDICFLFSKCIAFLFSNTWFIKQKGEVSSFMYLETRTREDYMTSQGPTLSW